MTWAVFCCVLDSQMSFKSQVKQQLLTTLIRNYFKHLRESQEKNILKFKKEVLKIMLKLLSTLVISN